MFSGRFKFYFDVTKWWYLSELFIYFLISLSKRDKDSLCNFTCRYCCWTVLLKKKKKLSDLHTCINVIICHICIVLFLYYGLFVSSNCVPFLPRRNRPCILRCITAASIVAGDSVCLWRRCRSKYVEAISERYQLTAQTWEN